MFGVAKDREDNAEFALKVVFTRADCFSLEREVCAYKINREERRRGGELVSRERKRACVCVGFKHSKCTATAAWKLEGGGQS